MMTKVLFTPVLETVKGFLEETHSGSTKMTTPLSLDDKELLIIMEVDTDPTGKVCVVFTRKGKALVKIVGEPIPGFFLSEGGSIHPRHALRGIAIVSISEMEDLCE